MLGKSNITNRRSGPDRHRRDFIGGSDARVIRGQDEKALIRLWQEKRGEVESCRAARPAPFAGPADDPTSNQTLLATGLLQQPPLTEADSLSATVMVDELNAGSFQRSTQCGFISERYWDFPINDLRPADGCYADF
jgi:hypothetical protein